VVYSQFHLNRSPFFIVLADRHDQERFFEIFSEEISENILNKGLPPAFTLVSCSAYFSTLKTEAICSSETSVDFQWTTRRYIPEDSTLHSPAVRTSNPTRVYLLCQSSGLVFLTFTSSKLFQIQLASSQLLCGLAGCCTNVLEGSEILVSEYRTTWEQIIVTAERGSCTAGPKLPLLSILQFERKKL
jgi:hypothetical protein